jgi:hypothetical protein
VDAEYRFVVVDTGSYWRSSDGGMFAKSAFGMSLENGSLALPNARSLQNVGPLKHVFVAVEAFPLRTYLMRPHAGRGHTAAERIFN